VLKSVVGYTLSPTAAKGLAIAGKLTAAGVFNGTQPNPRAAFVLAFDLKRRRPRESNARATFRAQRQRGPDGWMDRQLAVESFAQAGRGDNVTEALPLIDPNPARTCTVLYLYMLPLFCLGCFVWVRRCVCVRR
jgi:hypothetical protein